MTPSFQLATIPLPAPVTVFLPAGPSPRTLGDQGPAPVTAENGTETALEALDVAFWLNLGTRTIHTQIARISTPLLIYGPEDFAAVASDLPEHHAARTLQCLGADPAASLQALIDRRELPVLPPRVPREIAQWRARTVLDLAGLLPAVESTIAALTGPGAGIVRHAWQSAAPLARHGPTVSVLAPALGLTDEQVDAMFIQAAELEV